MSDKGYNTNLAAEFHVLSVLHRLGLDAVLTLGNKKSVDIAVVRAAGDSLTVDVKGLAGRTSWPVDNAKGGDSRHFLVFVCFAGRIADPAALPEVWVVPSTDMQPLVYHAPGGRKVVMRATLLKAGAKFRDAWTQLGGDRTPPERTASRRSGSRGRGPLAIGGRLGKG